MKSAMLAAVLFLIPSVVFGGALQTAFLPDGTEYLVDRFIITTTEGTPQLEVGNVVAGSAFTGVIAIDNLCADYDVVRVEPFYDGPVKSVGLRDLIPRMYVFHVAPGADVLMAQNGFKNAQYIENSDLYDIPRPLYDPDDPQRGSQWHLSKIEAYSAWDIIRGDTTRHAIVSIVDSGVYWMHPDLAPNMWINEPEDINGNGTMDDDDINGLDDDGNGYIDDVIGWDNGANDNDPREETPFHGTHVAGCASEATDNGIQGAGIGFSARVMANKGANIYNQLTAVYPAMIWATENGAHIINCSWGSPYYNGGNQTIINGIWESGVVVVAAAGNEANSQNFYPAAYNNVLAVAATNSSDIKAGFSSYGDYVDVCAPGVGIFATWATGGFIALQGTSMSSPITAGTCGLLKAAFPDWTNADIVETIILTADNIDDLNPNYAGQLGSGRINAYAALASMNNPNILPVDQTITLTVDDGDGVLNPGESFDLVVTLENIWADAIDVSGTLRSNENFTVSDSVASFGDINRGESADNSDDPYSVTVSPTASLGSLSLVLEVQAEDYEAEREIFIEVSLHQAGFPLEISGNVESSPLIFDFDQDGENELIFGANSNEVFAVEADGHPSPGWPIDVNHDVITGPAVGDLAGNGSYQVVAVSKAGSIYAWNADGSSLPNFPVSLGGLVFSGALLVDLDGDDDLEIAVGTFSDNSVHVLHHDGSEMDGWPVIGSGKWYGSPSSGDVDGDGLPEILYAGFDSLVHAFNADGNHVDGFPVQLDDVSWPSVSVGDVDGDTEPEIAAVTSGGNLYLINHDGSIVDGFPMDFGTILRSPPSMADIDGGGAPEIIFGGNNRMLHAIGADASEIPGFPIETGGAITGSPVTGDITGDGLPEVLIGTSDGFLYGFESDGNVLANFPIEGPTTGQILGSAALGDLDGDGDMEIAAGMSGAGLNLMVIDYKADASVADLIWPNFGKDIWRSGNYSDVVTSVEDQPMQPQSFGLAQNYPNPFNATTTIRFSLKSDGEATLSVYDLLGRRINTLKSGRLSAGTHSIAWNGKNEAGNEVASGVYFYRLESTEGSETRRMLLLK
jgi:hypothetical protein